jgi:hypothetical protein
MNVSERLNFCQDALQSRLENREVVIPPQFAASICPKDCASVSAATLLTSRVVTRILQSQDDPSVTYESLRDTYQVLWRGGTAEQLPLKEKRVVTTALTAISDFLLKKNPSSIFQIFGKRDPESISAKEFTQLQFALHQVMDDRSLLAQIVTHDALEYAKDIVLSCFENQGGKLKIIREKDSVGFDWENMSEQTPEAIGMSIQLERAGNEGKFISELSRILSHTPSSIDPGTKNTIEMWQLFGDLVNIGSIQKEFARAIKDRFVLLIKLLSTIAEPNVQRAQEFAREKMFNPDYKKLQEHFSDPEVHFSFEKCFEFFAWHLNMLSKYVTDYYSANSNLDELYEEGYSKYIETLQKNGFNAILPATPEAFISIIIPNIDPINLRYNLQAFPLFHALEAEGQPGIRKALASIIDPENPDDYSDYLLNAFKKIPSEYILPPSPQKSIDEPAETVAEPPVGPSRSKKTHKRSPGHKKLPAKHRHSPPPQQEETKLCEKVEQMKIAPDPEPKVEVSQPELPQPTPIFVPPLPAYKLGPPLLKIADRVNAWFNMKNPPPHLVETQAFHTYSFFITRLIMAYVPEEPWVSPTTHKINRGYCCAGTFQRLGIDLFPIPGLHTECFDGNELYHHHFKPVPLRQLMREYKEAKNLLLKDEDAPPSQETAPIIDLALCEFPVTKSPFSLKTLDTRRNVEHVLLISTF